MGHLLSTDSLQFGYIAETSTTKCAWLVMEVASYHLRRGTPCILTLLDCSKAFNNLGKWASSFEVMKYRYLILTPCMPSSKLSFGLA